MVTANAVLSAELLMAGLFLALVIDHVWGEPPLRWHPVVWMGRYLDWAAKRFAPQQPSSCECQNWKIFSLGAAYWLVGAGATIFLGLWINGLLVQMPYWLSAVFLAILLKPMLAWRMLWQEVQTVDTALQQSLDAGRLQLARLVSRDVSQLSASDIREAAIETLAENLNDSVVAPVIWFVLLGLPAAMLYRFANTADAMWGYPAQRGAYYWQWAGKWAARADDVLSWLPARITALLMLLVHSSRLQNMAKIQLEAVKTPSPNSGWPMAAIALALGLRLGKPGVYVLNAQGRACDFTDIPKAIKLARNTLIAVFLAAQIFLLLIILCR